MIVIGVDPGLTGAVARYCTASGDTCVEDIPTKLMEWAMLGKRRVDGRALAHMLRDMAPASDSFVIAIEAVGIIKGEGNAIQSVGSLCGTVCAILAVADVIRADVMPCRPADWKADYGLKRAKGEKAAAWKNRSRIKALELFPALSDRLKLKKHADRAEALLIARWAAERCA